MPQDLTSNALHWADIGDNRVGPLMRELVVAISETTDPHEVRRIARNLKFLSSSINTMAHTIAIARGTTGRNAQSAKQEQPYETRPSN